MWLSKTETVVLAQVLAIYADGRQNAGTGDFQRATDALRQKAEEDLGDRKFDLEEEAVKADEDDDNWPSVAVEDDDEEADDDGTTEEDPASKEDSTERSLSGEGDESPAEAAGAESEDCCSGSEESCFADITITVGKLLRLPSVTVDGGKGRFFTDGDQVNFAVVGDSAEQIEGVSCIKRGAKTLQIYDEHGGVSLYRVNKWPKAWTAALPVKKVAGVLL